MRLVLDTCVIVSAFRSRAGASFRLLELLKEGRFEAVATPILLFEYEAVLMRPEQRMVHWLSDELLEAALRVLANRIEPVIIDFQWKSKRRDPHEDKGLESTINGYAYAIVTHNIRDFLPEAGEFGIRVATPSAIIKGRFSAMAAASSSITLPEHIVRAAEVQARMHGVSLEEWVSRALAERLDTPEGARAFFRRRAAGVQPCDFARVLDAIPSNQPNPGDELETP